MQPDGIEGLAWWLKANDAATITDTAGAVTLWSDKSGNGRNVSQTNAGREPTTGVAAINGNNVLRFAPLDYMERIINPVLTAPYTTFVVFRLTSTTASFQYLIDSRGPAAAQSILTTISNTSLRAGAGTFPTISTGLSTGTTYIADWVLNGASSEAAVNGVSSGTVNMGSGSRTGLAIGATRTGDGSLDGDIAEIIVYNRALSSGERLSIRQYLAAEWGVTLP